jgi:putative Mg2+ transporter-C (MgtC) family protein
MVFSLMPNAEFVLRLAISAVLGSLIGMDRERLLWAAGLRTHMLVCVGSCLVMIVSVYGFASVLGPHVILDPSRVAAQVVSGVGFLGAGSIILRNEVVKGLTTAASLWTVAAVGLAVGSGLYVPAVAGTIIILVILVGLKPIEARLRRQHQVLEIRMTAPRGTMTFATLEKALGWRAGHITQLNVQPGEDEDRDDITIGIGRLSPLDAAEALKAVGAIPGASDVRQTPGSGSRRRRGPAPIRA